ncbi:MAG TPA: response regulator [Thermoanaerobaculia bacterium]|nr:response regulator [Thermoanaerobaculia bacterium]
MPGPVLIVEDDPATTLLFEAVLNHASIGSDHAADGAEALRKIEQQGYEAILLDLVLPVVSGFELLRHLKDSRPDVLPRVVVVTAAADSTWRACAEIPLVHCLLRKPVDIGELVRHVQLCRSAPLRYGQA